MSSTSRERILIEALRLFGEQGFAKPRSHRSNGLPGLAGALYRHFKSKDELLVQAVDGRLTDRGEWEQFLAPTFSVVAALDTMTPSRSTVDNPSRCAESAWRDWTTTAT
ncbi:TetR/AcrR family transcriptional regulator [Nocardia sp. IBHARD005]|uniref:TetR/AcrR family transcriptional regulator n=1 Tax=Nocardia sp. IBHARD005 TaxID=3457765 RepID=UPI004058D772